MSEIEGVRIKQLTRNVDSRGYLMEILRADDEEFMEFGQAYVSACFPGIVKAWHCHAKQWDHFCCVAGNAKIGLFDDREDSATCGQTQTVIIGALSPALVKIPPFVWHGMMALGGELAVVLNLPTETYDYEEPDELRREAFDATIPFEWHVRGG